MYPAFPGSFTLVQYFPPFSFIFQLTVIFPIYH